MNRTTTHMFAVLGGLAIATSAAMAQPKPASPATNTAAETAQQQTTAITEADKQFMQRAAESGLLEVEASKLAEERAHSDDVKTFAQSMIKDHTEANLELETIAKKKGFAPPLFPSDAQKEKLQALSNVEGEEFDRLYAKEIGVMAHQEAVTLFNDATTGVKDPELTAYAVKTLPRLKKHLGMAEDLERKVSGSK
jgi:putative membrane protein